MIRNQNQITLIIPKEIMLCYVMNPTIHEQEKDLHVTLFFTYIWDLLFLTSNKK